MDVASIIDALGDTNALAAYLGVVPSAVRNWRSAGAFPLKHHIAIVRLAKEKGVHVPDDMFRALSAKG